MLRSCAWGCDRPPALVTQEEVEAEKERMRAVDARPVKKVAEAKARKRKRLQVHTIIVLPACELYASSPARMLSMHASIAVHHSNSCSL